MKKIILVAIITVCAFSFGYAQVYWLHGHAMKSSGTYLNGWTIKCGNGTYGSAVAQSPNGSWAFPYSLHPGTGSYTLTADSAGMNTLYSGDFFYNVYSEYLDLGIVPFYTAPR